MRTAETARAELEPAAEEAEARGADEPATSLRSKFIAGAVDPEIVILCEAIRVRDEQTARGEGAQAELVFLSRHQDA